MQVSNYRLLNLGHVRKAYVAHYWVMRPGEEELESLAVV